MLAGLLIDEGYAVDEAPDGHRGLHLGLSRSYDLVVLDRRLPTVEGLDLLARLRTRGSLRLYWCFPRSATRRNGWGAWTPAADDYLAKPFDLDELSARLRALRRRHLDTARSLPLGSGRLDLDIRQVHRDDSDGADPVRLSERESALLATLAGRARSIPDVSCSRWCSQMPKVRWW